MSVFTQHLITLVMLTKKLIKNLCGDSIDLSLNSDEKLNELMKNLAITDPYTYGIVGAKIKQANSHLNSSSL
jgi:hypothetical protein